MTRFEIGKTYMTRSPCDYDCLITVTIAKRTAKTVTDTTGKTYRPHVWQDTEHLMPWGRGSLMPTISADREET